MASNYTELKAEIASYVLRAESEMPVASFISLAETELQPVINHYEQEKTVTVTSAGNIVILPADMIKVRSYSIAGVPLVPTSIYDTERCEGKIGYTTVGKTIQLVRSGTGNVDVVITYRARFAPLSNTVATNWLLTKFPNVYLSACLAKAYRWLKDKDAEAAEQAALQNALQLVAQDHREHTNGGNQIQLGVWDGN